MGQPGHTFMCMHDWLYVMLLLFVWSYLFIYVWGNSVYQINILYYDLCFLVDGSRDSREMFVVGLSDL